MDNQLIAALDKILSFSGDDLELASNALSNRLAVRRKFTAYHTDPSPASAQSSVLSPALSGIHPESLRKQVTLDLTNYSEEEEEASRARVLVNRKLSKATPPQSTTSSPTSSPISSPISSQITRPEPHDEGYVLEIPTDSDEASAWHEALQVHHEAPSPVLALPHHQVTVTSLSLVPPEYTPLPVPSEYASLHPSLLAILPAQSKLAPHVFDELKLAIARNPKFLGKPEHLTLRFPNKGSDQRRAHVPGPPLSSDKGKVKDKWYCVTCGTQVGIFRHWNEVALAVNGQSNGVQAGYNVEMEAYVQFQIILLRGRIQVING